VYKKRPQKFAKEVRWSDDVFNKRVAANPPNLLARNQAPLCNHEGLFYLVILSKDRGRDLF